MKVTNWRRKLMASLAAGGLLAPSALVAANLKTNLVVNPGFEDVGPAFAGAYDGTGALGLIPRINGWSNGPRLGYAYTHDAITTDGYDYAAGSIPSPPGGGLWYFGSNATDLDGGDYDGDGTGGENNDDDVNAPGQFYQTIGVSTGVTGTTIANGLASYRLKAYFNTWAFDADTASLQVDFFNSGGTPIGSPGLITFAGNDWTELAVQGTVSVGTASARISPFGTRDAGGPDAYIDNVDFQVFQPLILEVNTANGQVTFKNQSGAPVNIDYYEIRSGTVASPGTSLNATAWNSLQEQNLAGFPAGNGSGNGWEQAGGSNAGVVGESYLTANSAVANNATIGLGAAFNIGGTPNLVFQYGEVLGGAVAPAGDYNGNGTVDAADYVVWRNNNGSQAEYNTWRANFGLTGGPSGPSTLITGFVRYVTSGAGATAAVPEPSTVLLVGMGLASLAAGGIRKRND